MALTGLRSLILTQMISVVSFALCLFRRLVLAGGICLQCVRLSCVLCCPSPEEEVRRIWESCKPTQDLVELRNLILVAKLVVDASIDRKENIGLHYNQDLED